MDAQLETVFLSFFLESRGFVCFLLDVDGSSIFPWDVSSQFFTFLKSKRSQDSDPAKHPCPQNFIFQAALIFCNQVGPLSPQARCQSLFVSRSHIVGGRGGEDAQWIKRLLHRFESSEALCRSIIPWQDGRWREENPWEL